MDYNPETSDNDLRHPSTEGVMKYLRPNPRLGDKQLAIAEDCFHLAECVLEMVEDSHELAVGLRKLLEAKDAFVRASLDL